MSTQRRRQVEGQSNRRVISCRTLSRWAFVASPTPALGAPPLEAVAEALMALSSAVALGPGGVWLEVGRSVTLFGSEWALARRAREIAETLSHAVVVAVTDRPETARMLAATSERPITLIAPDGDASALASLPIGVLDVSPGAESYLTRLGIRTLGDLARLAPPALRRRLGDEGDRLVRQARAEPLAPPRRYVPPERPIAARELEPPIPPNESVLFLVKTVLDELTARLAGRGLAIEGLRLSLTFESGRRRTEELLLPRPLRSTTPLLAIFPERLFHSSEPLDKSKSTPIGSEDWPERIVEIEVQALRTALAPQAQLSLLGREELDAEELATLLARLTGALGREAVFAAQVLDAHRPETTWRPVEFGRPAPSSGSSPTKSSSEIHGVELDEPISPRPVLVLPEPLPLEGELLPDAALCWSPGRRGVVQTTWGPERLRGGWWTAAPFDRDYYVVDLRDGSRIWVYRERQSEALFLQGIFD